MTTEPLEVIIVVFLITISLFAIYSYSRTNTILSGSEGKRLLARSIASIIAGMWKYNFVNGTYTYTDFYNEVNNFINTVESQQGLGVDANITFVYKNGTEKTFILHKTTRTGKTSVLALVPVVVSWNCTPDKVYVLPYTDEVYYSLKISGYWILKKYTYSFDNLTFFVIAYHNTGTPKTEGGAYVKLDYTFTDSSRWNTYSGTAYAPLANGGAVLNVSIPGYSSWFVADPPASLDVTIEYYPSATITTPSKTWTFSYGSSDFIKASIPNIALTLSGKQYYLYLLGETSTIVGAGTPTWVLTNRKGETLTGSGLTIPLTPPSTNPGFFVQGPFNITIVDTSGTVHIPFYVLPYMVLFKVRVIG